MMQVYEPDEVQESAFYSESLEKELRDRDNRGLRILARVFFAIIAVEALVIFILNVI